MKKENTYNDSWIIKKAMYQKRLAESVGMNFNFELYVKYLKVILL
jgi:hypothetical protein